MCAGHDSVYLVLKLVFSPLLWYYRLDLNLHVKEEIMLIGVTSANMDKLTPTDRVCTRLIPWAKIEVEGKKSPSMVNEQPEGDDEIIKGAENRIASYKAATTSKPDFIVSYENGIKMVKINGEEQWFDFVWVIVEDCSSGRRAYAFGQGVRFPTKFVEEARRLGFDKNTVGSVIARYACSKDSSDSQSLVTSGFVHRVETLELALKTALAQLLYP